MFYRKPTLFHRINRIFFAPNRFDTIGRIAAGIHTGHGLAHGVAPAASSRAHAVGDRD